MTSRTPGYRILEKALIRGDEFLRRSIPPRAWLVEGCIPHPSLGMFYAWRGSSKTYISLHLALALAHGTEFLGYRTPAPVGVLYIDGEMPLGDMHRRLADLSGGNVPAHFWILPSEELAANRYDLNLARDAARHDLTKLILHLDEISPLPIKLIVLDNWVSLVSGPDEDSNTELRAVSQWLIMLRHGEKSVLIVHHEGKSGSQRGASGREDNLDYSARITKDGSKPGESWFTFTWDKTRTAPPNPLQVEYRIKADASGRVQIVLTTTPDARL